MHTKVNAHNYERTFVSKGALNRTQVITAKQRDNETNNGWN